MREYFVDQYDEFLRQKKKILTFLNFNKGFPEQIFKSESHAYLFHEFEWVLSQDGWNAIKMLSVATGNNTIHLSMVDDWDYSKETLRKYGCSFMAKLPISLSGDEFEDLLIEEIGKTNDSLRIVLNKAVIYPESLDWIIYVEREHELGVLAINNHQLKQQHLEEWLPLGEEIIDLVSVVFRDKLVPLRFKFLLEKNYGGNLHKEV
ncbi:hypothetical protein MM326_04605 [Alkalihalobacillus sp. LMS6]|uniref:hypothetical protein n=1 Tax=Alkalihalobacillus sp. LMS6 TaxID=2924034 RepID=UPI0020D052FB|nr:hypothetical protein [Alkalihalobacillus sp. LMS6]UTR07317.1 hypothetical protein MM326_04605 [Alkalihalobacillus sp. LMS6]